MAIENRNRQSMNPFARRTRRMHPISVVCIAIALIHSRGAAELTNNDVGPDFQREVRPILSDHCFACHGPDAGQRKAGLRLDVADVAVTAGLIVPGQPLESELFQRLISHDGERQMPPPRSGKSLSLADIDVLKRWIANGAKYAPHWAYQAPQRQGLPRANSASSPSSNAIDSLVTMRLEKMGLSLSPVADRRTLIRRLSFDLTGLPPRPGDVEAFVADDDPRSYDRWVAHFLASEHFGERMASYWLDLVRYADTVGYHGDQEHHAAPYRDYVINAFNENLPFDQFTREQLAGDLLPHSTIEQRVATCYNRLLQTSHEGGVQAKEYLAIYAADRVRNFSAVWLAATLGCAQCHDHKYDPYTTRDFYSLAAFFADVDEAGHLSGQASDTSPTTRAPEMPVATPAQFKQLEELDERIKELEEHINELRDSANEENKQQLSELLSQRKLLSTSLRRVMITQAMATPRIVRILPRGNWLDESGPVVEPAVPAFHRQPVTTGRATRLDLANWLTDTTSGIGGLTARVFVNRLWYLFFGAGLSRSLDDFGAQGELPTDLELLDELAMEFVESQWNVKLLVQRIVSSQTYRQTSLAPMSLIERDPENRLWSRQGRWRLPAESIRDTALAVSGLLVRDRGGTSARPYQPAGYYRYLNFPQREYVADTTSSQWRRGVYVHWQRQFLHPMLKAFDAPSREECTAQRPRSNTPLAALVLLNDPTFVECARVLAAAVVAGNSQDDSKRVDEIFQQALNRRPDDVDRSSLLVLVNSSRMKFQGDLAGARQMLSVGLAAQPPEETDVVETAAWTMVCRAIFNLSETFMRE